MPNILKYSLINTNSTMKDTFIELRKENEKQKKNFLIKLTPLFGAHF